MQIMALHFILVMVIYYACRLQGNECFILILIDLIIIPSMATFLSMVVYFHVDYLLIFYEVLPVGRFGARLKEYSRRRNVSLQ